jgi:hypothetical protein
MLGIHYGGELLMRVHYLSHLLHAACPTILTACDLSGRIHFVQLGLLFDIEFVPYLLALAALLVLEKVSWVQLTLGQFGEYLLFQLLHPPLLLVPLRGEHFLHDLRVLLLLRHQCIVHDLLLLGQLLLKHLLPQFARVLRECALILS